MLSPEVSVEPLTVKRILSRARVDIAVYEMIKAAVISKAVPKLDAAHGGFNGDIHSGGVAEGWTGCSRLPEKESFWESAFNFTETPLLPNVLTRLTEARDGIIAETIVVPSGYT